MRPLLVLFLGLGLPLALPFGSAQPLPVPVPSPKGLPAGTLLARWGKPDVRLSTTHAVAWQNFRGLRVTAGPVSRVFPAWQAISNPTFWPTLDVQDVTGDRRPDVLVTLMTDEGTGVAVYDLRVLTLPDLREIPVTPPVAALRSRVRFGIRSLVVGGQTVNLDLPEGDFTEPATVGSQVRWSVHRGRLTAEVEVQQTWAFVGRLLLTYRFAAGKLVPDRVTYDPSQRE